MRALRDVAEALRNSWEDDLKAEMIATMELLLRQNSSANWVIFLLSVGDCLTECVRALMRLLCAVECVMCLKTSSAFLQPKKQN